MPHKLTQIPGPEDDPRWKHDEDMWKRMDTQHLIKEWLEMQKASFDRVFGHNAAQAMARIGRELKRRGIQKIPNIFGDIDINPGIGKGFTFHGSFQSQILARRREIEIPGSFIIKRGNRYYVLKPKRNPPSTGIRETFRRDIVKSGDRWFIMDFNGFRPEVLKGPFTSLSAAKHELRIMKSRRRYTTSPRYHATLGLRTKYKGGQKPHVRNNPGKRTLIYGELIQIWAKKTSGPFKGQRFTHKFRSKPKIYGLSNGALLIQ